MTIIMSNAHQISWQEFLIAVSIFIILRLFLTQP